ncbi:hypothetical protein BST37_15445 [Mycobacterium noviomagense]|uniref:Molecular chaperone n=1 Tax=Mycobacterium noviomagense TaxID=459858 RepID=A0ABX3T300_9MYCO|nr:hypothetical protein BST37_15445 [Mycobacterium noviomagense]
MANLVAARVGSPPVSRRSVLTLFGHRPPEVGTPDENPNLTEPGLVLQGFIERVGDPTPFVAADGSTHRSDVLAVEALEAVARTVNYGAPVAVAVPAHWREESVVALREALRGKPSLAPQGAPPALISDATAALAALYAKPGFPTDGMVALCDFGASGTSVTLTDAASNFRQIGETVRYTEFSGHQVDQAILRHLQAHGASAYDDDGAKTAPVGSLARRLDQCRRAKEQLSAATVALVPAEMPGVGQDVRLSRAELEEMVSEPLDRFVATIEQILQRNEIPAAKLAAIATVGGGACIPLITERLSDRLRVPIVTTPTPMLSAAIGAAVLAQQRFSASRSPAMGAVASTPPAADATVSAASAAGAATERAEGVRPAFDPGAPPGFDAPIPTDMAPSAWAANAALSAADESSVDGAESATYRALAWSQDPGTGEEPVPYTGEDHSGEYSGGPPAAPVPVQYTRPAPAPEPEVRARFKGSPMLFFVAAIAALVVLGGLAVLAVKISTANTKPTNSTSKVTTPSRPSTTRPSTTRPASPPPVVTVTETQEGTTETTVVTPPPSTVVTTTQPPTTTTTRPTTAMPTTTRSTTPYVPPRVTSSPPQITNPAIPIYPGPVNDYGP